MYYSKFIYLAAKAGANYNDPSMTYENFLMGKMDETDDYAGFLDKAFLEANSFFQRLSVLHIIPSKIEVHDELGDEEAVLALPTDCLQPMHVFQYLNDDLANSDYINVAFRKDGSSVYLQGRYLRNRKVRIQYRPKIAMLGRENISWIVNTPDANGFDSYEVGGSFYNDFYEALTENEEGQLDLLETYGITDEMLMVGIDWIKGRLNEDESKGHSQELEAESRLQDLSSDDFEYAQYRMGKARL